jgi:hypothetical protein
MHDQFTRIELDDSIAEKFDADIPSLTSLFIFSSLGLGASYCVEFRYR